MTKVVVGDDGMVVFNVEMRPLNWVVSASQEPVSGTTYPHEAKG